MARGLADVLAITYRVRYAIGRTVSGGTVLRALRMDMEPTDDFL